jgi:hypothetical protein
MGCLNSGVLPGDEVWPASPDGVIAPLAHTAPPGFTCPARHRRSGTNQCAENRSTCSHRQGRLSE